ncbi:ectoine/hydroxyectoine ABC transporter substrate-binding protein EhuB [Janibacter indicus]|uniref:Ectoine/hydroxyectoine ABC transporter substrate-binding protein EhuB n=1 Tax=Janibacter indicus TaxID=857417 RepID=A0A1L3MDM2_9MICO|nr:ectoine/hydroxyectoine ABC transporter substrate-binding protein EhuB [Janibacter indicus]APH00434.1 ectoine/hydroxyectoine ABC transporter substrate-binding protein EhuB [Janibacter indicus]QOK23216.1 ectoine/hydroxyectoine ABC transporter substrate-binding protein EhuB [Janibacter indicus]
MRHSRTLAGTAALTLALTLAACGSDSGSDGGSGDKLAELKEEGTITVAFAGEEPYSFEKDGELTGATIALHEKIFKDLGIKEVKGVKTEWNALIPGLKAGRYDAISAGMSILPDRCKEASFGDPEILYTTALMVPEGNPKNLKDLDDVKKSGAKLATMSGAIETDYAKSLDIEATQVKSPQDGMDAVARGSSDVFALTGISLRTMDENNPDVKVEVTDSFVAVVDGKEQVGAGATVFKKGDDTLRDAYNEELAKITGDEKAYTDVIGEFGFTDAERPKGDLTTEQLCKGELPDAK